MRAFGFRATVREIIAVEAKARRPVPRFFRELIDAATTKCYGIQILADSEVDNDLERMVGFYGQCRVTYYFPFEVQRGHKIVRINATKTKPKVCLEHIYPEI